MFGIKGNLTPAQRALLKLAETLLAGAFIAGAQAALPLLSNPNLNAIAWGSVLHTFFISALVAISLGVSKYHTAQADPPLAPPVQPSPPDGRRPDAPTPPAPAPSSLPLEASI